MKARALGLLAIATALFAPIPSGAQQKPDGVTSDECKKSPPRLGVTELVNEPIRGVPGKCIRVTQIELGPTTNRDTGLHVHPGDEYGLWSKARWRCKRAAPPINRLATSSQCCVAHQ